MSLCILLVEHDERLLHRLGRELRAAGYLVLPLSDADEALDLLCLTSFDLVLADVATLHFAAAPGAPGLTALARARRGAPLLLFTTQEPAAPVAANPVLMLTQPVRDLPRLLETIARLVRADGRAALHADTEAVPHPLYDSGDIDDLIFPPLSLRDTGSEQLAAP